MVLCDICHEKPAHIFYTEVINGEKKEQHLCEECAAEHTIFSLKDKLGNEIPIGNILTGILNNYSKNLKAKQASDIVCNHCGMTMSEVIKTGKLGCPECYNRFASFLDKNLKTIHGANVHRGKEPLNAIKLPYHPDYEPVPDTEAGTPNVAGVKTLSDILSDSRKHETEEVKQTSAPKQQETLDEKIERVKKAMAQAVEEEDYMRAAELRDILHKAMEQKSLEEEKAKPVKKTTRRKGSSDVNKG